jgi:hypothetical protein
MGKNQEKSLIRGAKTGNSFSATLMKGLEMSDFKTEVANFFENLVAQDKASGFANEVICLLPEMGEEPHDLSDDKYAMEHITSHFGEGTVSLKAIAIERDAGGAGDHEFVIELMKKATSDIEFVKISIDNIPQDMDGDSFCTEFQDYEFVQPFTKTVTAFR